MVFTGFLLLPPTLRHLVRLDNVFRETTCHNLTRSFLPIMCALRARCYLRLPSVVPSTSQRTSRRTGLGVSESQPHLTLFFSRDRSCPLDCPGLPRRCSPTRLPRTQRRGCHEIPVPPHKTLLEPPASTERNLMDPLFPHVPWTGAAFLLFWRWRGRMDASRDFGRGAPVPGLLA